MDKLNSMNIIASTNNKVMGFKIQLRRLILLARYFSFEDFPLLKTAIINEIAGIKSLIAHYERVIETRVYFLLQNKTFGEIKEGKLTPNSLTKYPISYISTIDIHRGYILLNEIILDKDGNPTDQSQPIIFYLDTGEIEQSLTPTREGFESIDLEQ